jgi:hypothetical protein
MVPLLFSAHRCFPDAPRSSSDVVVLSRRMVHYELVLLNSKTASNFAHILHARSRAGHRGVNFLIFEILTS